MCEHIIFPNRRCGTIAKPSRELDVGERSSEITILGHRLKTKKYVEYVVKYSQARRRSGEWKQKIGACN